VRDTVLLYEHCARARTLLASMSHAATMNSSSQLHSATGFVTQAAFESLVTKFETQAVAHKRLEHRVTELQEELSACKQELLDERARTQEITLLATQQLQEWTLQGLSQ
jgi:hypothetical protein